MSRGERFAGWVWDRRKLLALACALITLAAIWQAGKVGVDNSLRIWFLDGDPHLVAYRSYQERFGSDEVVLVVFRDAGGMASGAGLQLLSRAETLLGAVDGVSGVISIAGYADAVRQEAELESALSGARAVHPGEEALRRRILEDQTLRDRLISRDGATAAIVVRMQAGEQLDARRDAVLRDIERALDKLGAPHHLAGIGVLYLALNRLSIVDAFVLFCGALGVMFALLCVVYRRVAPAVVTLGVATAAMLWTMGLYGAAGRNLNMVTSVMPTLILVIGVAEMVHILLCAADLPQLAGRREKAVAVISRMLRPCLLNIVTSAAGFAALALSPLPAVRDLGIFSAAGLLACLLLTLVGTAFALASPRCEPRAGGNRWLRQCAGRLCEIGIRRPALTLSICAAITLAAAAVGSRVVVDTFTLEFLSPEHPVRRDSELIEERLAPYVPLDFLVRGADGAVRPELLAAIGRWQRAGERLPGVGWSRSPADTLGLTEKLDPRAAQDGTLRVTFSVRMQSARGVERTMRALLEAARMPQGTSVQPAGYLPLYVRMIDYIVDSQISGFAFAFIAIFGVIALAFRSAPIAALAVPSNLLPLVFIFGAMGAAGIRLDAATVTIAAVVLGLVVDDTVHFLHRLHDALGRCADRASALRETVRSAGHAILTTALVMTLGFSVFALSEIRSLVHFGLLIALAMASSVVTDLLLIPALVMLRRSRTPRHAYRSV